jgi:hypothetical protein
MGEGFPPLLGSPCEIRPSQVLRLTELQRMSLSERHLDSLSHQVDGDLTRCFVDLGKALALPP